MAIVKCTQCGNIINTSRTVDKMISLYKANPNISFHPTYFNRCSICGNDEVDIMLEGETTKHSMIEGSVYKLHCLKCGQDTYFKYNKIQNCMTIPFKELKCSCCGSKQGTISEQGDNVL